MLHKKQSGTEMQSNQADIITEDILLKKLEEYGDSLEYEGDVKSPKRRKNIISSQHVATAPLENDTRTSRRKKKKRKKKTSSFEMCNKNNSVQEELVLEKKLSKKEQWLHDVLGSTEDISAEKDSVIPDETQIMSKHKHKFEPEVIVFHDPAKRKKKTVTQTSQDVSSTANPDDKFPEFDMRQARYDVRKFGINGFYGTKKDESISALLVSLGAKPPNKKYYNYKEYQQQRKMEIQEEVDKMAKDRASGLKVVKKKKQRFHDKNDIGKFEGQIGKYKSGVQFIKKQDVKQKR